MKKVVIVESPSKSKTIESYLDPSFKVLSSVGHIRDLSTSGKDGLGIDIENNFTPRYRIIKGKDKLVADLKKACKGSEVYLATDPDREGEAISYHLATVLELPLDKVNRIEFHEITKPAVLEAFKSPRYIDMDLVNSQETRRMIDRIIGFKLSKLLKSRIKSQSAGRVQSVALKLIVDLEDEINAFIPTPYYQFKAHLNGFDLSLDLSDDIKDKNEALELLHELKNEFVVDSIETKQIKKESKPPFTTSTMAQDASIKLGFNSARTMRIAQGLYEGKEIMGEHMGLITYMRTDSTHLSDLFVAETYKYIETTYGKEYKGFRKEKKQMLSQNAHEAIRPTSIYNTPEKMKPFLTSDEYKLYNLIYIRALSSLMSGSRFNQTKVIFVNNNTKWYITGRTLDFDGYIKAYGLDEEDTNVLIPSFNKGDTYQAIKIDMDELFTKPKSRYTEASLIKDMERLGIGRPSTYAQTMTTLKDRKYIEVSGKSLVPTEQGILTVKSLDEYFSDIINVKYTANMETELDRIAKGEVNSVDEMKTFYNDFIPLFDHAKENMDKLYPKPTGKICPICGSELVVRLGKFGEFTSCSNYPTCKYIEHEEALVDEKISCPKCGDGYLIKRESKKGRSKGAFFWSCSNFPKCTKLFSDEPTKDVCPKCGAIMLKDSDGNLYCSDHCSENDSYKEIKCPVCDNGYLVRKMALRGKYKGNYFYACDNRSCKTIYNDMPTNELCPNCGSIMLMDRDGNLSCAKKCSEKTEEVDMIKCPNCKDGYLVKKQASKGKNKGGYFYGCNAYPRCKTIYSISDELCQKCGSPLLKNGDKMLCSNKNCK